jgi:hypothetical protein
MKDNLICASVVTTTHVFNRRRGTTFCTKQQYKCKTRCITIPYTPLRYRIHHCDTVYTITIPYTPCYLYIKWSGDVKWFLSDVALFIMGRWPNNQINTLLLLLMFCCCKYGKQFGYLMEGVLKHNVNVVTESVLHQAPESR